MDNKPGTKKKKKKPLICSCACNVRKYLLYRSSLIVLISVVDYSLTSVSILSDTVNAESNLLLLGRRSFIFLSNSFYFLSGSLIACSMHCWLLRVHYKVCEWLVAYLFLSDLDV